MYKQVHIYIYQSWLKLQFDKFALSACKRVDSGSNFAHGFKFCSKPGLRVCGVYATLTRPLVYFVFDNLSGN